MTGMDAIVSGRDRVLIHQTKEWGEILLGFESKNRYELRDDTGAHLGYAAEEAHGIGQWFLRNIFGHCRRATVHIYDAAGTSVGRGEKPFRWFFHRMQVFDGARPLGSVQRKWAWFHRVFAIENLAGAQVMELRSPFLHPWTFTLRIHGREAGVIRKKWGGLLKEVFTDADVFGVEMDARIPGEVRKLLLVATFLVDFTCFENNTGVGGVLDVLHLPDF
jgi:uncharacterized protein YxjI